MYLYKPIKVYTNKNIYIIKLFTLIFMLSIVGQPAEIFVKDIFFKYFLSLLHNSTIPVYNKNKDISNHHC